MHQIIEPEHKALTINLNEQIYGTFAEIGAGQEVARHFFQVGAAAGTIAKTMSAYDKVYSDQIYGREKKGRYVCQSRLIKMLDHEYELMEDRLGKERPDTKFFVFADTVATLNYSRTIKGDGWLGLRFQLSPDGPANQIIIHVKMHDNNSQQQQQAVGILGVNLIHGCYYKNDDIETLIVSLMDTLEGRISIDMIDLQGPDFQDIDNRWLSYLLVKNGLTNVAMFGPDGKNRHPSEFLYKKSLLIVRGNFLPPTKVNMDMLDSGLQQFINEPEVDPEGAVPLVEITLDHLHFSENIKKDFLDRANLLCAMNQTVIISNCQERYKLVHYLADYKIKKIGLVIGVEELRDIFTQHHQEDDDGALLISLGKLFTKQTKIYGYPSIDRQTKKYLNCINMILPDGITFLFSHLIKKGKIEDIHYVDKKILSIWSQVAFQKIQTNDDQWEKMVPEEVANVIKEQGLFGYQLNPEINP